MHIRSTIAALAVAISVAGLAQTADAKTAAAPIDELSSQMMSTDVAMSKHQRMMKHKHMMMMKHRHMMRHKHAMMMKHKHMMMMKHKHMMMKQKGM